MYKSLDRYSTPTAKHVPEEGWTKAQPSAFIQIQRQAHAEEHAYASKLLENTDLNDKKLSSLVSRWHSAGHSEKSEDGNLPYWIRYAKDVEEEDELEDVLGGVSMLEKWETGIEEVGYDLCSDDRRRFFHNNQIKIFFVILIIILL